MYGNYTHIFFSIILYVKIAKLADGSKEEASGADFLHLVHGNLVVARGK